MRTKTYKLAKLEKNRKSILTNDLEHCYVCGRSPVDMHEICGGCNRQTSIKNDFCVPLCRDHHRFITTNTPLNIRLKQVCQQEYEKTHTREEWMSLIGKNYLANSCL